MRTTITIDGRGVPFEATAATVLYYKNKTGGDIFKDFTTDDTETGYTTALNLAYVMAWQADRKNTPDTLEEWLDSFETFDMETVLTKCVNLWAKSLKMDVDVPANVKAGKDRKKKTTKGGK